MGRPRNNPNPQVAAALRKQMHGLRKELRLTAAEFAFIIRLSPDRFISRERGITPWSDEEVITAKKRLAEFVAGQAQTLRDTFGEDAFPITTANQPIKLKLTTPLTDRHREQLTELLAFISELPTYLKIASGFYHDEKRKKEAVEAKLAELQASADVSEDKAARLNTLQTQIGLLETEVQKKLADYRLFHEVAEKAIQKASRWAGVICQPLLQQYSAELTQALEPFYENAGTAAQGIVAGTDGFAALNRFLAESSTLEKRGFTTKELADESARWTKTIGAILNGEDVFTYKGEALVSA